MIPAGRFNFISLLQTHTSKSTAAAIAITESMMNLSAKTTGVISAVVPATNNILNILLPTMLPIARSALPLYAAVTDVTSSGSEVPSATIVSPMTLSLIPNALAIAVAPSTARSLPNTIAAIPPTMAIS